MIIDTHAHINSKVLINPNIEIERINTDSDIQSVINVGLNINTSKEAIKISEENKKIYSSVGIHPLFIKDQNSDELPNLITDKVVAIGEIGLDYSKENINEQRRYFIKQLIIANELHLPVIIHSNNMTKEIIQIFKTTIRPEYGCVFHCFQPVIDDLLYLVSEGYYISFAGKITYKTAKKSLEIAKIVPNDLFMLETDSPYISPEPHRNKENNSSNIKYIVQRVSEVKGLSYEEIETLSNQNAMRLFKKLK